MALMVTLVGEVEEYVRRIEREDGDSTLPSSLLVDAFNARVDELIRYAMEADKEPPMPSIAGH